MAWLNRQSLTDFQNAENESCYFYSKPINILSLRKKKMFRMLLNLLHIKKVLVNGRRDRAIVE